MKKVVLGLFATVMFAFAGSAQVKLSVHEKAVIDAQMISLVHLANSTVYQKGMTQSDYFKQVGPLNPSRDETTLLQKMYQYAVAGTSDCDIMKGDNSVIAAIAQSGNVSESAPDNRWPWHAIIELLIAIAEVFLPSIP